MKLLKTETALTIFFTAIVTSIATIIVSPISITLAFWLNDYLARPILSVEYIQVFPEYDKFVNPRFELNKITFSDYFQMGLLNSISSSYDKFMQFGNREYLSDNEIKELIHITREIEVDAREKLDLLLYFKDKILQETFDEQAYIDYSTKVKNNNKVQAIGDDIENLDTLASKIRIDIENEAKNTNDFLSLSKNLLKKLETDYTKGIKNLKFKLSIQNKGNTDGLIKSVGSISIPDNGISFSIINIPAPKKKSNVMAIAVTIADDEPEAPTSQSVGKVEMRSLKEFWFEIEDNNENNITIKELNLMTTNKKPIEISINLFDHNNNSINKNLFWKPFNT